MKKSKSRKKKPPKRVVALPDLEHAKTAVLNSLTVRQRVHRLCLVDRVSAHIGDRCSLALAILPR
jgi:hypothetical protein